MSVLVDPPWGLLIWGSLAGDVNELWVSNLGMYYGAKDHRGHQGDSEDRKHHGIYLHPVILSLRSYFCQKGGG